MFNRGEINADQVKKMRPQNAEVACVHAFAKTQKEYIYIYIYLQKFNMIIAYRFNINQTTESIIPEQLCNKKLF